MPRASPFVIIAFQERYRDTPNRAAMANKPTIPATMIQAAVSTLFLSAVLTVIPLPGAGSVPARDTQELVRQADEAFFAMRYELADSLYSLAQGIHPGKSGVYWKLSRLYVGMGEALPPENTEARHPFFERAEAFARTCTEIDPNVAEGHTWLAASLGVLSDNAGAREKIKRANIIKSELEQALEINPHDDVALSILGSFHREISDMGWLEKVFAKTFLGALPEGSREEAETYLKRAIASNPLVIRHYHELGKLYRDMERYEEALEVLDEALTKPVLMKSDVRRRKNIKALMTGLSKKL